MPITASESATFRPSSVVAQRELSPAARRTLVTRTIPAEDHTLAGLDRRIRSARASGDTGSAVLRDLLNRYDWLAHQRALQQSALVLDDARAAAAAARSAYARTAVPAAGADRRSLPRGDADDAALTWGIVPGADGRPGLTGLPAGIAPDDVQVRKRDGAWVVTFAKSAGAYAAPPSSTRFAVRSGFSGGSSVQDPAIERGRVYKLNPAAARLWEATNTDPTVGRSALVVAQDDYDKALAQVQRDPEIDAAGRQVPAADAVVDFSTDQTAALKAAGTAWTSKRQALTAAKVAAVANPLDRRLQSAFRQARADVDLATRKRAALDAIVTWQSANYSRQLQDADRRAGVPATARAPTSLEDGLDSCYQTAIAQVARWNSAQWKVAVGAAQDEVDDAQAGVDDWRRSHAIAPGQAMPASPQADELRAARDRLGAAQAQLAGAATRTADANKAAYLASNLAPGQQDDSHAQYRAFMRNPRVMAQPIIDQAYADTGGAATSYDGLAALAGMVSGRLGTTPDETGKITAQIARVGGVRPEVTVLPVVFALDAPANEGGGVQQTALFDVQDAHDPRHPKFVDADGARYASIDDYRANNRLPAAGVDLVIPSEGRFSSDGDGNVRLAVEDARTETGWQHAERVTHAKTVAGVGLGTGAGLLFLLSMGTGSEVAAPMALESAGLLSDAAVPMAVGATSSAMTTTATAMEATSTAYTAWDSADDDVKRGRHGLSVNPLTDGEARQDAFMSGLAFAAPGIARAASGALRATSAADAGLAAGRTSSGWIAASGRVAGASGVAGMVNGGVETVHRWNEMDAGDRAMSVGQWLLSAGLAGSSRVAMRTRRRSGAIDDWTRKPGGMSDSTFPKRAPSFAHAGAVLRFSAASQSTDDGMDPAWQAEVDAAKLRHPVVRQVVGQVIARQAPGWSVTRIDAEIDSWLVGDDTGRARLAEHRGVIDEAIRDLEHRRIAVHLATTPEPKTYGIRHWAGTVLPGPEEITAEQIVDELTGGTRHNGTTLRARLVGEAIGSRRIRLEILSAADFEAKTHSFDDRDPEDTESGLAASFASTLYLNRSEMENYWTTLLDVVHEGVHILQFLHGADYLGERGLDFDPARSGTLPLGAIEAEPYEAQIEYARAMGLTSAWTTSPSKAVESPVWQGWSPLLQGERRVVEASIPPRRLDASTSMDGAYGAIGREYPATKRERFIHLGQPLPAALRDTSPLRQPAINLMGDTLRGQTFRAPAHTFVIFAHANEEGTAFLDAQGRNVSVHRVALSGFDTSEHDRVMLVGERADRIASRVASILGVEVLAPDFVQAPRAGRVALSARATWTSYRPMNGAERSGDFDIRDGRLYALKGSGAGERVRYSDSLGELLGFGGFKMVFALGKQYAVGILNDPETGEQLDAETRALDRLRALGLPVVDVLHRLEIFGRDAIVYRRYAASAKHILDGRGEHLNAKSIADLQRIRRILVDKGIDLSDPDFLVADDGSVVLADPVVGDEIRLGTTPSTDSLETIDALIHLAQQGM